MSRCRERVSFLGGLTLLLGVWGTVAAVAEEAKRPNILFIMSDDHAYQAIGAYGHGLNRTPNIDRIARDGMRFDRGYVTNSICGPCRAVILTGKYSHLNGFRQNGDRFDGGQPHVAKLLQAAGYTTAVVGKWHLETAPTGFDYYRILRGQGTYYNPVLITAEGPTSVHGYTTDIITDEAVKFLGETRDKSKPFFLMVHHKAPHRHWMPGPDHLDDYDDVTFPEPETLFDDYSHRASGAADQAMSIADDLTAEDLKLVHREKLRPLQHKADDRRADEGERQGCEKGHAPAVHENRRDVAARHCESAVGEIDEIHQAERHGEAAGQDEEQHAVGDAVEQDGEHRALPDLEKCSAITALVHHAALSAVSTVMLPPTTRDTQVHSFLFAAFSSSLKNTSR